MLNREGKELPVDRMFSNPDMIYQIFKQYNFTKYLVDGISLENLNFEYLALNPRLSPSLIKEIIKLIGDEDILKEYYDNKEIIKLIGVEDILKEFYHNLAKNENPKVFSILRKEYRYSPDSDKLDWTALSANPNAISILVKEYKRNPLSNRIDVYALSSNTHLYAIRILKKRIEYENDPDVREKLWNEGSEKTIDWYALSANPTAIKLLRKEYERDPLSNRIRFGGLSKNPNISELKDILEANFNKLDMEHLASNPFAPRELLEKIMEQKDEINGSLFRMLAMNPNPEAITLLRNEYIRDPDSRKIKWHHLSANPNPEAITLLKENNIRTEHYSDYISGYISFARLEANPTSEAFTLLKKYIDIENIRLGLFSKYSNINWDTLSSNPHPEAIELLREKIEKERKETYYSHKPIIGEKRINWEKISANTGAIELIIEKLKKEQSDASGIISKYDTIYRINIDELSKNPAIFVKYEIHATDTATTATTAAKKSPKKIR